MVVENNALRVAENKSRSEEFVRCQGNADCVNGVNEKYKKISAEQHESVVNCKGAQDCVDKANEVGKLQADYANRANELKEYARIHGSLTPEQQNELSILEGTSIQLEADRTEAIHRAMMSGDSPEANKLAIDALAQAVGTSAAGIAAGVGKGKTVGEGVAPEVKPSEPATKPESKPSSGAENSTAINTIKNTSETQISVDKKLDTYLLEKEHPVGGSKAEWFDSALGFTKANSGELAKQIVFDPHKAIKTTETQFGTKFDQVIPITGANGRTISVKFGWIENNDGVVRLVTAIPAKK